MKKFEMVNKFTTINKFIEELADEGCTLEDLELNMPWLFDLLGQERRMGFKDGYERCQEDS